MTKISQYQEIALPDVDDLLIGTDVENDNSTKNFSIQSIVDLVSAAAGITPTLQQVTIAGNETITDITANKFKIPGGTSSKILAADGSVILAGDNITIAGGFISSTGGGGGGGITSINNLSAAAQSLEVGTTGTNFNIDSSGTVHRFNIPSSSASNRGLLSNTDWINFNSKQADLGYVPVNRSGDTMSGLLVLSGDPGTALGAATKQYVDNISGNVVFNSPVYTATTGNLTANYSNGTAGVGATLTATTNGALQVDGEFPSYLDRVLVWKQTSALQNGVYTVDVVGDSVTPYRLIRSADSDNNPLGEIRYGDYTLILSGDTNGGKGFICNTSGTITVGTTPITFVQYNVAQAVTPGFGLLTSSPNVIAIDTAITQGKISLTTLGTGEATLIGNTLNIPVTSGGGGGVGTVTEVAALTLTSVSQTDLSSTVINETSTPIITLNVPNASATNRGVLTAANFTTFNNKQNALVSGVNIKTVGGLSLVDGPGDIPLIYNVLEKTADYLLASADNGKVITFTAPVPTTPLVLTVPLSLPDGFECTFVTMDSTLLTVTPVSGVTLYNNSALTMFPKLSFTLKRVLAPNKFITSGNL
jgi:hypothetical protein